MSRRRRLRDTVDLMQQKEGYRMKRGFEMMDNDESFPTFEEDEELDGFELEISADGADDVSDSVS